MRNIDQEAKVEKRYCRIGEFIDALPGGPAGSRPDGTRLLGMTVRFATEEDPSVLVVVKASTGTGKVVCFVGAYTLGDAMLALRARLVKGSMKWREDRAWSER